MNYGSICILACCSVAVSCSRGGSGTEVNAGGVATGHSAIVSGGDVADEWPSVTAALGMWPLEGWVEKRVVDFGRVPVEGSVEGLLHESLRFRNPTKYVHYIYGVVKSCRCQEVRIVKASESVIGASISGSNSIPVEPGGELNLHIRVDRPMAVGLDRGVVELLVEGPLRRRIPIVTQVEGVAAYRVDAEGYDLGAVEPGGTLSWAAGVQRHDGSMMDLVVKRQSGLLSGLNIRLRPADGAASRWSLTVDGAAPGSGVAGPFRHDIDVLDRLSGEEFGIRLRGVLSSHDSVEFSPRRLIMVGPSGAEGGSSGKLVLRSQAPFQIRDVAVLSPVHLNTDIEPASLDEYRAVIKFYASPEESPGVFPSSVDVEYSDSDGYVRSRSLEILLVVR